MSRIEIPVLLAIGFIRQPYEKPMANSVENLDTKMLGTLSKKWKDGDIPTSEELIGRTSSTAGISTLIYIVSYTTTWENYKSDS